MSTILILALDGVMDSSLALTLDTLRTGRRFLEQADRGARAMRRAAAAAAPARPGPRATPPARADAPAAEPSPAPTLLLASHQGAPVRTGGGMLAPADLSFAQAAQAWPDWIVAPGLGLVTEAAIDARLAEPDARAALDLLRASPASTRIAASCSAVFLLAATGLLAGRAATMTWWLAHLFRARHPAVRLDEARMLVHDGRFLTAGSAYAQLDLALAVTAETMGPSIAHLCARYLLIDQRPSQARYMMQTHARQADPVVLAAERWIDARLAAPVSIAAMAADLAVSARTLARRIEAGTGLSPIRFVQRRRLMQAVHLIETTAEPIDAIAARVGYQDGTALRKLVRRELGVAPGALRKPAGA